MYSVHATKNRGNRYADYEIWPENERWELIDGVAWNISPAPYIRHQRILGDLNEVFRDAAKRNGCEALFAPVDVMLFATTEEDIRNADTVVQPDLLVVCDEKKLVSRGCLGAPDIVVEILSTYTMRKDITIKHDVYERAGVREYWIVDPGNAAVMIFRLGDDGRYPEKPEIIELEGMAKSAVLSDLEVTLPFES